MVWQGRMHRFPRPPPCIRVALPLLCGALALVAARASEARVNPLTIIKRQIHKPNMLVVLDTSGSMTGVPGNEFEYEAATNSYPLEVGVDCDNGVDCRAAIIRSRCNGTGRPCTNAGDCPGQICTVLGAAEPLGMCRAAQTLCGRDADCTQDGDSCGAPVSRTVIAKRSLSRIITENYKIINLGLMTFYQSGYFPYYRVNAGTTATTEARFFGRGDNEDRGCFDSHHGPTPTCDYQGLTYTLAPTPNSQYEVNQRGRKSYHDMNFCGQWCAVPGIGLGKWRGSYYVRTTTAGSATTTLVPQATYTGKNITVGGVPYRYFTPRNDYYTYNAQRDPNINPPIQVPNCGASCSATCGGRWDDQLAPFLNPTATDDTARTNADRMLDWMEKAANGGLVTYGGTPSGCTLENDVTRSPNSSAYDYMFKVRTDDTLKCRKNFVLFITDGEANGPGDDGCDLPACAAADPIAAHCTCRAVKAAWHLRNNDRVPGEKLDVRTFVVGFSKDAASGVGRTINDNIARAGGTDHSFAASNESELALAIQSAIYEAVKGSYATSPATSSSGTQLPLTIQAGKYVLDSRVDFPSWQGHLLAYDISSTPPTLAWDAATQLQAMNWWERRVYIGMRDGTVIKVDVDSGTKAVTNKATLSALGLGTNPDEAERIVRFMLGDPASKNPAILGAIVNSTPIDVGQPGDSPLPGGHEFFLAYRMRPGLTYVGSDDGMLHALFTNPTAVAGKTYAPGSEAFAYIPHDMLPVITKIHSQGGQIADPAQHIFGLANSAKVKSLCVSNCTDAASAVWKTLLVMPEGYGGSDTFVLDVTNPVSDAGFADPPVAPVWHTEDAFVKPTYDAAMGLSVSLPGFFFNKTDTLDDHRLVFASGYRTDGPADQGRQIIIASAATGAILDRKTAVPPGSCAQEYTLLADVATAKDFARGERAKLLGAYVGDTWGGLWRYSSTGLSSIANLGCQDPLHFAPTVVQLDRDDPTNFSRETYLVQVTNSAMDEVTADFAEPSKMVIMKEKADINGLPVPDPTFGAAGKIVLTVGTPGLCGRTGPTGACEQVLPANARPMGTPMGLLKRDGSGFQLMSLWYTPDTAGCTKGKTYLALHEVVGGAAVQKQGMELAFAQEPIASAVVVAGHIYVVSSAGLVNIGGEINATYVTGSSQSPTSGAGSGRFNMLGWTEM